MDARTPRLHTIVAILIGAGMLYPASRAWSGPTDGEETAKQGEKGKKASKEALESLADTVDTLEKRIAKLEGMGERREIRSVEDVLDDIRGRKTPEKMFNWVREAISFEPYSATMRGPKGVLEAGAGNAADQAALLAAMFEEEGVEYRFASGSLPASDARKLVTRYARQASLVSTDEVGARDALATKDAVAKQRYLNLVQDHVWLEVKTDEGWTAADPVLSKTYGGVRIQPEAHHDELPRRHEARLRVSLHAKFTDGQRKRVMTIEGPLPRFSYKAIELRFLPSEEIKNMVVPRISLADQHKDGERFLPDELASLTLQYHARIGQVERQFDHVLFRRDSDMDNLFEHDDAIVSVSVLPGWTSKARLATLAGEALGEAGEAMEAALKSGDAADAARRALQASGVVAPLVYAHHLDRLTEQLAHTLGVRPVLLQPRIVRAMLVRDGSELSLDLDIRGGQLEAIPRKGIPESAATGFLSLFGRVETQLRRAMVQKLVGRKQVTVDSIFSRVQEAHVPVATLHSQNVERLEKLDVPDHTRRQMRKHIVERGWILLSPMKQVTIDGSKHFGWWSVEPLTGLLRGNLAGALADLNRSGGDGETAATAILQGTSTLLKRVGNTTKQTIGGQVDYTGLVCEALGNMRLISRSLCATSKLLDLPEISACGSGGSGSQQDGGGSDPILGLSNQSCSERVSKTRCGAAVAAAFLKGRLAPMYGGKEKGRDGSSLKEFSCVGR